MDTLRKIVSFAFVLLITGCVDSGRGGKNSDRPVESGSPGRRYELTAERIPGEETKARAGDAAAAMRLANHYQWIASDEQKATYWLRRGAELNDPFALINLSSILAANGDERSCKEAQALLNRVLSLKASSDLVAIAKKDMETLRDGVDGAGYCVNWLK